MPNSVKTLESFEAHCPILEDASLSHVKELVGKTGGPIIVKCANVELGCSLEEGFNRQGELIYRTGTCARLLQDPEDS